MALDVGLPVGRGAGAWTTLRRALWAIPGPTTALVTPVVVTVTYWGPWDGVPSPTKSCTALVPGAAMPALCPAGMGRCL